MTSPHFLFVGNGPYTNRGCEAIVRGTMVILRREFGEEFRVTLGTFGDPDIVAEQAACETDSLITHVPVYKKPIYRWSLPWWRRQLLTRWLPFNVDKTFSILDPFCKDAACALQIGGDNYTLDYGLPSGFIHLDDFLHRQKVPVMLWGASVGPFESNPVFAKKMYAHLRTMRAIFVRESDSYVYLKQHGIETNLHQMSDPAFVMEPIEPSADKIVFPIPLGAIGLNLSPLMMRYVSGGDKSEWVSLGAKILQTVVEAVHHDVLLIPHTTSAHSNDHAFLRSVVDAYSGDCIKKVYFLDGNLSAAETKWVISRCAVFAGARTHSTIAAISSGIPTLSFAYSRKARGLNQDIFGTQDYCLKPSEITPANVAQSLINLLAKREAIADHLAHSLPGIRERALQSGAILRSLIGNGI